jgi:hypothetical protein
MAEPTTVRGWLETLPEPIRGKAVSQCTFPNMVCGHIADALDRFTDWAETNEGHSYWNGTRNYIIGLSPSLQTHELEGYNAAKEAFEAQEKPTHVVTEIWEPKPDDTTDITWAYLHEVEAKAAAWDTLQRSLKEADAHTENHLRTLLESLNLEINGK